MRWVRGSETSAQRGGVYQLRLSLSLLAGSLWLSRYHLMRTFEKLLVG